MTRCSLVLLVVVLIAGTAAACLAREEAPELWKVRQHVAHGEALNDIPERSPAPTMRDTIDFGFYEVRPDGLKYAVRNGIWTWDHGAADPLEGWTSVDMTANDREYWRHMTQAKWVAEGNPLPWPQMNASAGLALLGSSRGRADSLGWASGIGYANQWCQRLTSPTLTYDGTGSIELALNYFSDTEADYDYSKLFVNSGTISTLLNPPGFNGRVGVDSLGVIVQEAYARTIQNADFGGGTAQRPFTVVIEFQADGAQSDEDGDNGFDSFYGPLGVDNISLANNIVQGNQSYNFDNGLQGWIASRCPGVGAFMGIASRNDYIIQDPCECELAGNVLEMHNASYEHPDDQHEMTMSPIIDRKTDIGNPQYLDYNRILVDWDQYVELPQTNGVFYRGGYSYYPYDNPAIPGMQMWSPRVGIDTWYYVGADPICYGDRSVGTDWGLPAVCEKMRFVYEVASSCDRFAVDPCSGITNFTPIIDNVRVRNVGVPNAPAILFESGGTFNDGFGTDQVGLLSTADPGNADITYNLRFGSANPARLGDSLVAKGPVPNSQTKWESKLWFRVKRQGPAQGGNALFNQWKNALLASKGINFFTGVNPPFTWGYMDSVEAGTQISKNKFCSQFRDGPSVGGGNLPKDLNYNWGGGGEQAEGNEMIPDLALTPGTKIDFFVTSNYVCLPNTYFYLPDTTGRFYDEFEILPSIRLDGGQAKFPCVLYIDAFNRGAQFYIENALNVVLNGAGSGDPIPDPTRWDRLDYRDADSNWNGSFYREFGGNAGATVPQLLGYRAIMVNTGTLDAATESRDWQGLQQWLEAVICDGNINSQAIVADGASASKIINNLYPRFLSQNLGAVHRCESYFEQNCPSNESENDQQYCVRVDAVPGSPFAAGVPSDVFGNWCPAKIPFGVLGTTGTGAGNKNWVKIGTNTPTQYAQIINDRIGSPEKYRSVIDDFSYHLLTARDLDAAPDPDLECPIDSASRVNATFKEIENALKWTLNISNLQNLGLCALPGNCGEEVPEEQPGGALVNRLYQNHPNPFNPRTVIRFSLASAGPCELAIFDASGRKVRTLVSGAQTAGAHEAVWDGTNDAGRPVASGVFWSQLKTDGFASNKKMVVLK